MKRVCYYIVFILAALLSFSCNTEDSFEMVVLPDTQTYMEEFPEVFESQMAWLASQENRFKYVIHVGDITQNNSDQEWEIAAQGFSLIKGKIPYTIALGNHDMGSEPGKFADTRNTEKANRFFPLEVFQKETNVIASFPEGTIDNLCTEFLAGGMQWLVFSLEFGPRNKTLAWAENIIKAHPKHKIIINTHAYMYEDNTLQDGDDWWQPQAYGVGKDVGNEAVNNGKQLWEKLVKKYKNIVFVFSGHVLKTGVGTLVSKGTQGNNVYQMLANYQKGVKTVEKGDSGYLRIIKVDKTENTISVKTFSPWLNKFKTDIAHDFVFKDVKL